MHRVKSRPTCTDTSVNLNKNLNYILLKKLKDHVLGVDHFQLWADLIQNITETCSAMT